MINKEQSRNKIKETKKKNKNNGHFSDLLENDSEHMFSSKFMESIIKQDEELNKEKKVREANERFIKIIEDISKSDSFMGHNKSEYSVNITMSVMNDKENSDLSWIKSEATQDQSLIKEQLANTAMSNGESEDTLKSKRKTNVFEYNNLASNNKKMRLINLNKPLQRTDIIQLENSLDFEKSTPTKSK